MKNNKFFIKCVIWVLFAVYLIVLVYFLFFSEKYGRVKGEQYHYNLIPFSEIKRYLFYYNVIGKDAFMINIIGNVAAFVPFGMCVPLVSPSYRNLFVILFDGLLFTVVIESVQLILKVGTFDVDDIILNTTGVVLGYVCYKIIHFIYRYVISAKR